MRWILYLGTRMTLTFIHHVIDLVAQAIEKSTVHLYTLFTFTIRIVFPPNGEECEQIETALPRTP